ncbi:MAG TPA: helix-turn-helix transcriptional regulator [Caulobacteraceae bacterium]|nr:helix-turn-helix transcriptional regulator [Caulobacteraceae bacterium]
MNAFAIKLNLVLKALSMSRARLAADVGVDKSVVSRWASGATEPSMHNLALLTAVVAGKTPGFRVLDWDLGLDGLAEKLGLAAPPPAEGPAGLPLALLDQARATTALRGDAYEGFYRSLRPYPSFPGRFIQDEVMVRRMGGLLQLRMNTGRIGVDGWVLPLHDRLFTIGCDVTSGAMVFAVLYGVNTLAATALDGITVYASLDVGRTPTATPIILRRTGDLSGDPAEDDATLARLGSADPAAPPQSVSEDLARHLSRDVGGEWVLRMPLGLSMTA